MSKQTALTKAYFAIQAKAEGQTADFVFGLNAALHVIKGLYNDEQQQIEESYNDGLVHGHINDSETYFSTTYGTEHGDEREELIKMIKEVSEGLEKL